MDDFDFWMLNEEEKKQRKESEQLPLFIELPQTELPRKEEKEDKEDKVVIIQL